MGTRAILGAGVVEGAEAGVVTVPTTGSDAPAGASRPAGSGALRLVDDTAAATGAAGTGSSRGRAASDTALTTSATVATIAADRRVKGLIERSMGVTTLL